MYILDTNIIIYYFKSMGNVTQSLLSKSPQDIAIPAIVLFELEVGIAKSNNPHKRIKQLEEMISAVTVLPFTEKEAKTSAMIRSSLESKGLTIGPFDILIAGTTLANQGILVTHNTKEFNRIDNLQLEDWY